MSKFITFSTAAFVVTPLIGAALVAPSSASTAFKKENVPYHNVGSQPILIHMAQAIVDIESDLKSQQMPISKCDNSKYTPNANAEDSNVEGDAASNSPINPSSRLVYDDCEYQQRLYESTSPLLGQ